jgi:hypothetical protein
MQIFLTIFIGLVFLLIIKYPNYTLKYIKKLFRKILHKKMLTLGNESIENNLRVLNDEQTNEKLFQFHRVKVQTKRESFSDDRLMFGIPKKRSGHRAVCNDQYLYIWGGYCPLYELNIDDENEQALPLFPEVSAFCRFDTFEFNELIKYPHKNSYGRLVFLPNDGH